MTVHNTANYDGLFPTDIATGRNLTCADYLGASDLARSGLLRPSAVDSLTAVDRAEQDMQFCVDYFVVHDDAFAGPMAAAFDNFFPTDRASLAKFLSAVDQLTIYDRAAALSTKSAVDTLEVIEYLTGDLQPLLMAVDSFPMVDVAEVAGGSCGNVLSSVLLMYAGSQGIQSLILSLPAPLGGDTEKVSTFRGIDRSRGNDLLLTAPYGFRVREQSTIHVLKEELKEDLAFFLQATTCEIIFWRDVHGYLHKGFIDAPSTSFVEFSEGMWRVQLDYSELDPLH